MENRILNNRYKLETEIGRGGMGVVYRAIDTQSNSVVAIKILPPEFVHNTQFLARFNSEIRNTSQLQHQNIVSIYNVGVEDNMHYYVMQYIDGQDLKSYMTQHGKLSVAETCRILEKIAAALDFAHEQGIVHRDIKPENILIDRQGVPSLTDFGIARSLEGTRMTTGMVGTPEYMSPEQSRGEDVSRHSDQYSLAIVAYEMLTGTTPFHSSTVQPWAVITKHINEPPADPRTITPSIASNSAEAVTKGLAKKPGHRHPSCAQLINAMQVVDNYRNVATLIKKREFSPEKIEPSQYIPSSVSAPRHDLIKTLLVVIILIFIAILFLFVAKGNKSKPSTSRNSDNSSKTTVVTAPVTDSISNNENNYAPTMTTSPNNNISTKYDVKENGDIPGMPGIKVESPVAKNDQPPPVTIPSTDIPPPVKQSENNNTAKTSIRYVRDDPEMLAALERSENNRYWESFLNADLKTQSNIGIIDRVTDYNKRITIEYHITDLQADINTKRKVLFTTQWILFSLNQHNYPGNRIILNCRANDKTRNAMTTAFFTDLPTSQAKVAVSDKDYNEFVNSIGEVVWRDDY
ncbi:MAG: serine/threonine-protein kinase, partial [bacterium]